MGRKVSRYWSMLIRTHQTTTSTSSPVVWLLMGIVSSGATLEVAMQSLKYYGAIISGAACIFSVPDAAAGVEIVAAFHPEDVPDYQFYAPHNCPLCKAGVRIDALVNSYGYSEL